MPSVERTFLKLLVIIAVKCRLYYMMKKCQVQFLLKDWVCQFNFE